MNPIKVITKLTASSGHRNAYKVKRLNGLWYDEDGVTTVEYALLLAVLLVGGAAMWFVLTDQIGGAVALAGSAVETASET